ncbi:Vgr protein [Erwinia tracheiphila PSU-1]|nr:Vgr protein [Erwinia tracheiphila PSU-1]
MGDSQITLTPDAIVLHIGDSVIQLGKDGITINGSSVFVN